MKQQTRNSRTKAGVARARAASGELAENATTIDVLTVETASAELTAFLEARGFARVFCVALDSVFVAARLKKRATDWYGRLGRTLEPLCISDDLEKCSAGTLLEQCSAACTRTRCVKTG